MADEKHPGGSSSAAQLCIGCSGALLGALVLLLCNHDGYHFPWVVGLMLPLIIICFALLSIPLAPPSLAVVLKANRDSVRSLPRTAMALAFVWMSLFFGLGFAFIKGVESLREVEWICAAHAPGRVVALERTLSKGGSVEWAIYEYEAEGATIVGAVRNASPGFSRGEKVDVAYTPFLPRHSMPRRAPDLRAP